MWLFPYTAADRSDYDVAAGDHRRWRKPQRRDEIPKRREIARLHFSGLEEIPDVVRFTAFLQPLSCLTSAPFFGASAFFNAEKKDPFCDVAS